MLILTYFLINLSLVLLIFFATIIIVAAYYPIEFITFLRFIEEKMDEISQELDSEIARLEKKISEAKKK